jgi:hypothetical protein
VRDREYDQCACWPNRDRAASLRADIGQMEQAALRNMEAIVQVLVMMKRITSSLEPIASSVLS